MKQHTDDASADPSPVKIKMLGNMREYTVSVEYEVDIDLANQLTGMGYAVLVEDVPKPDGEEVL